MSFLSELKTDFEQRKPTEKLHVINSILAILGVSVATIFSKLIDIKFNMSADINYFWFKAAFSLIISSVYILSSLLIFFEYKHLIRLTKNSIMNIAIVLAWLAVAFIFIGIWVLLLQGIW